jgi:hypothetical protein
MILRDVNNTELRVVELRPLGRTETTFNFTVADFHTYFAGPQKAFVHNACGSCVNAAEALAKAGSYSTSEIRAMVNATATKFGSSGQAYNIKNEKELLSLFEQISKGGAAVAANYQGVMKVLTDGTRVGLREASKTGGKTIDVFPSAGKPYKVHIEP